MEESRIQITDRIKRLKERYNELSWGVSAERAIAFTESWKKTEGEPVLIRRAKGFAHVLDCAYINIQPDELIVGTITERDRQAPLFPEMDVKWLEDELLNDSNEHNDLQMSEETANKLREILPYWRGKTLKDYILKGLPQRTMDARCDMLFNLSMHEDSGLGHLIPDFETFMSLGLSELKAQYREKLDQCRINLPEEYIRSLFYEACIIYLEAISRYILRHSMAVKERATQESNPERKAELEKIALILDNISEKPANTFHEATQFLWFLQALIQLETNGSSVSIGRFDKFMAPYYYADIKTGRTSPEKVQELIDCLYLKLAGIFKARPASRKSLQSGITRYQNLTIGGVDENGRDCTTPLSYMCLTAREHCNTVDPQLSMRVHSRTPLSLLRRAVEVVKSGGGHPAFYSDDVIIPSLLNRGVPLYIARDYSIVGCVEIAFIGLWGRLDGGYTNMPKVMELAICDGAGVPRRGNFKPVNDLLEINNFEDFYNLYADILEDVVQQQAVENNLIDMIHEQHIPHIMCSLLTPGCMESGKDVTSGGAKINWTTPMGVGLANVTNAMYVIRKLVYEEKRFSLKQFYQILKLNWEGNESLRQQILHFPKYGNDEDDVDKLAARVVETYYRAVEKQRNHRNSSFYPALYSLTSNVPLGWATAATPDGRREGEPLAEGISPMHGSDINGPTAVLKSVSKIDWLPATGGIILNQKFNPRFLKSEIELDHFIGLIQTYLNILKGLQIQFNVVSREELLAAQENPKKHQDLIVRVTGYSARFIELSKAVQDDIIARTEHTRIN